MVSRDFILKVNKKLNSGHTWDQLCLVWDPAKNNESLAKHPNYENCHVILHHFKKQNFSTWVIFRLLCWSVGVTHCQPWSTIILGSFLQKLKFKSSC